MDGPKQNRRKSSPRKLEPIDWREFANDAVLKGNMSTLYHRPSTEDPSAYASPEALAEIEKRVHRPAAPPPSLPEDEPALHDLERPTVGTMPTVGSEPPLSLGVPPTVGLEIERPTVPKIPTEGSRPAEGLKPPVGPIIEPTVGMDFVEPPVGSKPPVGTIPTVGMKVARRVKPLRSIQDALTLAGQVLYRAMYGTTDDATSKSCTKGYRQLAAETHLDKDTVRDLISEFKEKGIVRETATYDPDTRLSKTYEILSDRAIVRIWQEAGVLFVTTGRQRPAFCTAAGDPVPFKPTVGPRPIRQPEGEGN